MLAACKLGANANAFMNGATLPLRRCNRVVCNAVHIGHVADGLKAPGRSCWPVRTMKDIHLGAFFLSNCCSTEAAPWRHIVLGNAWPHYCRCDGHAALRAPRLAFLRQFPLLWCLHPEVSDQLVKICKVRTLGSRQHLVQEAGCKTRGNFRQLDACHESAAGVERLQPQHPSASNYLTEWPVYSHCLYLG